VHEARPRGCPSAAGRKQPADRCARAPCRTQQCARRRTRTERRRTRKRARTTLHEDVLEHTEVVLRRKVVEERKLKWRDAVERKVRAPPYRRILRSSEASRSWNAMCVKDYSLGTPVPRQPATWGPRPVWTAELCRAYSGCPGTPRPGGEGRRGNARTPGVVRLLGVVEIGEKERRDGEVRTGRRPGRTATRPSTCARIRPRS
jgi:hypothetical protein